MTASFTDATTDSSNALTPAIAPLGLNLPELWPPRQLRPQSPWASHIPFAFWLMAAATPGVVVECGTGPSDLYLAFCQAVQQLRQTTTCWGISWPNVVEGDDQITAWGDPQDDGWTADLEAYHHLHYGAFSRLITQLPSQAVEHFGDRSVDLLHVAGLYPEATTQAYLETWLPKLSDRAVVLIHHINNRSAGAQIWSLWADLSAQYPAFAFLPGAGLGVLGVGKSLPTAVQALLETRLDPAKTAAVRQHFYRLGRVSQADEALPFTPPNQQQLIEQQLHTTQRQLHATQQQLSQAQQQLAQIEEQQRVERSLELDSAVELGAADLEAELGVGATAIALEQPDRDLDSDKDFQSIAGDESITEDEAEGDEDEAEGDEEEEGEASLSEVDILTQALDSQIAARDRAQVEVLLLAARHAATLRALRQELNIRDHQVQQFQSLWQKPWGLPLRWQRQSQDWVKSDRLGRRLQTAYRYLTRQVESHQRQQAIAALLTSSPLFDETYYCQTYPQVAELELAPVLHYIQVGAIRRYNPHPLFDTDYYFKHNLDVLATGQNPLAHYLGYGAAEGRDPHPLFDTSFYLEHNSDVAIHRQNPLEHYLQYGYLEDRSPHPLFDLTYYRQHNIDVFDAGQEPLQHYLISGFLEGRNPHPLFDTLYYFKEHLEIAEQGLNPLIHYITHGLGQGFKPNPFFDPKYYLDRYADVLHSGMLPMVHYLKYGAQEGRNPSADFNTAYYLEHNADVVEKGLNPLAHYLESGRAEGRLPRPWYYNIAAPTSVPPYQVFQAINQLSDRAIGHLQNRLDQAIGLPKLSVVMPVYNPPIQFLELAIQSVVSQIYPNWELCIADDCSTDPHVRSCLQTWAASDDRIRITFRPENGNISAATNTAAALATGDFIAFLDHDDELTHDALAEVALHLAAHPDVDLLYSDDDKIDEDGHCFDPQFKPDWSPELLLSYMYFSHLFVVRRSRFEQVQGIRVGFEGSQDYDFALRVTEHCTAIAHLPLVLYHWRATPGSTATSGAAKPQSFVAGERAVQEALARRQVTAIVQQPDWAARSGLGIFAPQFADSGPSVAIIIPTKNRVDLLRPCLESLTRTTYQNYRVVIIDNESDDPETLAFLAQCGHAVLRIANPDGRFSFAAINNRAVEQTEADYVLFLNNDTEILAPQWLSQMVGYAQLAGVGAVGAKLIYPDQRIQHAGIIHGLYHGMAGPAFKLLPQENAGYLCYTQVSRNYLAVTAACMLTPRSLFLELGGFDEVEFAVAYNDVDYGYRLWERDYRSVYCPTAELMHKEGNSRGFADNPAEIVAFRARYRTWHDPFYSPHLSLQDERFALQPRRLVLGASPRPIRALLCSHNLNLEGAPNSLYEFALQLKTLGILDPVIFSPQEGPLRDVYASVGIPVQVFENPICGVQTLPEYEAEIAGFADFIQSLQVDVVYGNTLQTFYAIAAAHHLGLPSIWNPRESETWQSYFGQFLSAELIPPAIACFQYPYRIVFVADATRDCYQELNSHHNFTVIHNGLNLERLQTAAQRWTPVAARAQLGVAETDIVLLCLGTVCARKGQQDLVQALMTLPAEAHERVQVFIVGDRPSLYSDQLHLQVERLPVILRDRVQVVAETDDTALYYQAADIFVFTSRVESYPRVTLEAMAYGLPLITTPVFGVQEQVQPGVNALLYSPGDIETLGNLIVQLLTDEMQRQTLAQNSPLVLQGLNTFAEMVQQYGQIFQEAYFSQGEAVEHAG